jgi:hypothetical protein
MKTAVHKFVQGCQTCIQAKPDRSSYPGKLQPLSVPTEAWETISMDFIKGLPRSDRADCILVVVDKFTRYAHFIPLSHPYTASSVAAVFLKEVYKLHGLPASIIFDRDPVFTSHFWQSLYKLSGTSLKLSSSYHPQTDGQTERVNKCLETYLRCFVHAYPRKWKAWLAFAEFWYNTSLHSWLGCSPFEALYGRQPRLLGLEPPTAASGDLDKWLQERAAMNTLIRQYLTRAQVRMKKQTDKNRSKHEFSVGTFVYLKLQPYMQSSVMPRANQKLSFKYFGPFKIVERIGSAAYRLLLPDSSSIHSMVHMSQLKLAAGFQDRVCSQLPFGSVQHRIPLQILDRRMVP